MKLLVFVVALAACAFAVPMTPLLAEDSPSRVPQEYVVVFDEGVSDADVSAHINTVRNLIDYYGNNTNTIKHEYNIGSFRGYGAMMEDKLRDQVRSMEHVQYVECSQYVHTARCVLQRGATWVLVRTTFRDLPSSSDYIYDSYAGAGVNVYILDTGIYTQHPDFGGRAVWGIDIVSNPSPRTDLNGHGTHVAGTVMSNTWGLAKKATAIAVRVLDMVGVGTVAGIIAGVNWVLMQHRPGKRSIANMSLGGRRSTAMNNAVDSAVDAGVHFAVSAGNENSDACNSSPASATKCITVGASNEFDGFTDFSNYGVYEHIIAPGVDITSTWLNGETETLSGTSMASPHVAGVMAKYLTKDNLTPPQMKQLLVNMATTNKISAVPPNTPPHFFWCLKNVLSD